MRRAVDLYVRVCALYRRYWFSIKLNIIGNGTIKGYMQSFGLITFLYSIIDVWSVFHTVLLNTFEVELYLVSI